MVCLEGERNEPFEEVGYHQPVPDTYGKMGSNKLLARAPIPTCSNLESEWNNESRAITTSLIKNDLVVVPPHNRTHEIKTTLAVVEQDDLLGMEQITPQSDGILPMLMVAFVLIYCAIVGYQKHKMASLGRERTNEEKRNQPTTPGRAKSTTPKTRSWNDRKSKHSTNMSFSDQAAFLILCHSKVKMQAWLHKRRKQRRPSQASPKAKPGSKPSVWPTKVATTFRGLRQLAPTYKNHRDPVGEPIQEGKRESRKQGLFSVRGALKSNDSTSRISWRERTASSPFLARRIGPHSPTEKSLHNNTPKGNRKNDWLPSRTPSKWKRSSRISKAFRPIGPSEACAPQHPAFLRPLRRRRRPSWKSQSSSTTLATESRAWYVAEEGQRMGGEKISPNPHNIMEMVFFES